MKVPDRQFLDYVKTKPCCWCGAAPCDPAHVYAKQMGGGAQIDNQLNVAPLCRACHDEHHAGRAPTKEDLWGKIADKLGLESWEVCRDAVWSLLRRKK